MAKKNMEAIKFSVTAVVLLSVFCVVATLDNMPENGDVSSLFPLTLIHHNDLHARYEETSMKSGMCKPKDKQQNKCIAGVARLHHMIQKLLADYKNKNAIYLNVGDNYQGTLWYNLLRWKVTAHFVKLLNPKVMTLGNHEFDHKPEGLKPYLDALKESGITTVVSNLELNDEKNMDPLPKSIVLSIGGRQVGIVGALYDKTHEIAQTGKVTLSNAVEAVKNEAASLKSRGVEIIVVLSHCSLDEDKKIARQAGEHIDVIVGAHSHSFLYSPESNKPYDSVNDVIEGAYPVLVKSENGRTIPIVQAKAYGKYVGRLTLYFDGDGEVKHWEGYPVFVDNSVPQDATILEEMKPWREEVKRLGSTVVGKTEIFLDRESCREQECTLGLVVADAFADEFTNSTFKPLAIIQAGNFRNPISVGDITNGDIIEAAPYGSTADLVKLKGDDIWNIVEHSFTLDDENRMNCLQVSGLHIVADVGRPFHQRVLTIEARDSWNPESKTLQKLERDSYYYVAVPSYLADGKDGFVWMKNAAQRITGSLDSDAFKNYIEKIKVVTTSLPQGRLEINKSTN